MGLTLHRRISLFVVCGSMLALLVGPPGTSTADAAACPGKTTTRGRGWTSMKGPAFEKPVISSTPFNTGSFLEVSPVDSDVIFHGDPYQVVKTENGGCSWKTAFKLPMGNPDPNYPFFTDRALIAGIHVPAGGKGKRVYILVSSIHPVDHQILRSDDGGESWRTVSPGFPKLASGVSSTNLAVSESNPDVLYLHWSYTIIPVSSSGGTVSIPPTTYPVLFRSADGGETWGRVDDPVAAAGDLTGSLTDLEVDPIAPNDIWAWGNQFVRHSTDGGKTWVTVSRVRTASGSGAEEIQIFHKSGSPAQVLVSPKLDRQPYFIFLSRDGGRTFDQIGTPFGRVAGNKTMTFGKTAKQIVMSGWDGRRGSLWRFDMSRKRWIDISPPPGHGLGDIQSVSSSKKTYLFGSYYVNGEVYRYSGKI